VCHRTMSWHRRPADTPHRTYSSSLSLSSQSHTAIATATSVPFAAPCPFATATSPPLTAPLVGPCPFARAATPLPLACAPVPAWSVAASWEEMKRPEGSLEAFHCSTHSMAAGVLHAMLGPHGTVSLAESCVTG
jgi:hypothetical protein